MKESAEREAGEGCTCLLKCFVCAKLALPGVRSRLTAGPTAAVTGALLQGRPQSLLLEPVRIDGVRVEEVVWSHFLKQCTTFLTPLPS